jgi:hypothetical protein
VDGQLTTVTLAQSSSSPRCLYTFQTPRDGFETAHPCPGAPPGSFGDYGDRMGNLRIYPIVGKLPRSPRTCKGVRQKNVRVATTGLALCLIITPSRRCSTFITRYRDMVQ